MKTIEVKKGEIIQRRGELNSKIYAVEKGLLRTYSIDEKGREHVFMFAPEGWIVT
ncbi:MAG: cyclic nucleotide-binding domain-containing protein, partial [Crocinitomicaceae bacterium]